MIAEFDQIVLTKDLLTQGLKAGDIGTVVLIHKGGSGFEVEFVALDGETIAVVSLSANQVRAIKKREIANVRSLELPLAA